MKKYILLIIVACIFGVTSQLRAEEYADNQKREKNPVRIENNLFTNISHIELEHEYGNVVLKESKSDVVTVEVQYIDSKKQKAACQISTDNSRLRITTTKYSGKQTNLPLINYIISLPKSVSLSVTLENGHLKSDKIQGPFSANLKSSHMNVQTITTKPNIAVSFGSLTIGEAQDLVVVSEYSNMTIGKAKTIALSGNYNEITIGKISTITMVKTSAYNSYTIGEISDLKADMKYDRLKISEVSSSINISCAYTDVILGISSPKAKEVNIKGSYSDVTINLSPTISANIKADLKYGNLIVSKPHTVKYSERKEEKSSTYKKGQIGTKTPTLSIIASNKYSDIRIK